jgi:NTE family protein
MAEVNTGVLELTTDPGQFIEPEETPEQPEERIALCLSGGGYRAMLFHLGALWRLNDAGMLPELKRISSVSGGSITAAVLGLKWPYLFSATGPLKTHAVHHISRSFVNPLARAACERP